MKCRISPATGISLVALFFSLTGVGVAATGYRITSIWQIAPKVRHELRGQHGVAGPQGARGIAGPMGPAGPTGAPGPTPTVTGATGTSVTIDPGGTAIASAACPSGRIAVGGGYIADPGINVFASSPYNLGVWFIRAENTTTAPATVQVSVRCL